MQDLPGSILILTGPPGALERHVIETGACGPEETLALVVRALADGAFRLRS